MGVRVGSVHALAAGLRRTRSCHRPKRTPNAMVTARKAKRSRPRELLFCPKVHNRVAPPTPSVAIMQKILHAMPALRAQLERNTIPTPMPTMARSQMSGKRRPKGAGRGVSRTKAMVPMVTNSAPAASVQMGSFFIGADELKVIDRGETGG